MVPFRGRESIFCSLRIRGKALQLLYRNLQIHPINPDQPVHILEISSIYQSLSSPASNTTVSGQVGVDF